MESVPWGETDLHSGKQELGGSGVGDRTGGEEATKWHSLGLKNSDCYRKKKKVY